MKNFCIKYLDDDGTFVLADSTIYEAESEIDALHQFAEARRNDLTITAVTIKNDDPDNFVLYIEGYVENYAEMRFDVAGYECEYIAVEMNDED